MWERVWIIESNDFAIPGSANLAFARIVSAKNLHAVENILMKMKRIPRFAAGLGNMLFCFDKPLIRLHGQSFSAFNAELPIRLSGRFAVTALEFHLP